MQFDYLSENLIKIIEKSSPAIAGNYDHHPPTAHATSSRTGSPASFTRIRKRMDQRHTQRRIGIGLLGVSIRLPIPRNTGVKRAAWHDSHRGTAIRPCPGNDLCIHTGDYKPIAAKGCVPGHAWYQHNARFIHHRRNARRSLVARLCANLFLIRLFHLERHLYRPVVHSFGDSFS